MNTPPGRRTGRGSADRDRHGNGAATADTRRTRIRQLLNRSGSIAGPPLGGVLVAAFGLAGALLVDAVTFTVIAIVLLLARPRWPRERAAGASVWADVRGGLSYV